MPRQTKRIQTGRGAPDGVHLWLVLWKAFNAVRDYAVKDIAAQGLSLTDFGILEVLLHRGPMCVNEIGSKVQLTSGSMTIAVDRLEARNLLLRRESAEDRRVRVIDLTAAGRKLIECAFGRHAAAMNQLGAALSREERTEVLRLLKKLGFAAADRAES